MRSRKDRPGKVIEGTVARSTEVSLSMWMGFIMPIFDDFVGVAMGTSDTISPAKLANHVVALLLINQSVNVNLHRAEWN
jgi:hypothetical protein